MTRPPQKKTYNVRWHKRLTTKLGFAYIFTTVLILIVAGTGLVWIAEKSQRNIIYQSQRKDAEKAATLISNYIHRAVDDLRLYSNVKSLASMTPVAQKSALDYILAQKPDIFKQLTLFSRDGTEITRTSMLHTYPPGELGNKVHMDIFSDLDLNNDNSDFYIGCISILADKRLISLPIALPLRDHNNNINEVLTADLDFSCLWQEISQIKIGETGYAYLVDIKGRFITAQKSSELFPKFGEEIYHISPVAEFITVKNEFISNFHEYKGIKNEPVIGLYRPVNGTDWAVIVELPTREAFAGLHLMQYYLAGLMLLGILAATVLSFIVLRRVAGPIRALTAEAIAISDSALHHPRRFNNHDEIDILSHTFHNMTTELREIIGQLEQRVEERTSELKKEIDERRQLEKKLRNSEEKWRSLVENAPNFIMVSDHDGTLLYINHTIPGHIPDEVVGKNIYEFVHPEYRDMYKERIEQIFRAEQQTDIFESMIDNFDGNYLWYETHLGPIKNNGRIVAVALIATDITKRKQNEDELTKYRNRLERMVTENTIELQQEITERRRTMKALRESEERVRSLFETILHGIYECNIDGVITLTNLSNEKITGYTKKELVGKHIWDLIEPGPNKDSFKEYFIDLIKEQPHPFPYETKTKTKDGRLIDVQIDWTYKRDETKQLTGFVCILADITEKREVEAQLQQAQRMEALGILAGGIAHDFNNLLMGIQGRASLLSIGIDSSLPAFEHLKEIEKYVISASDLTKQLLGFARGGKYEVKATDLNELIKNQNRLFGRTKKQITIRGKYEKNLWTSEVDQGQLEQVLLNIYINAWQAMPDGGNIYIETENVILGKDISRRYRMEPGNYVKISIIDTGIGMDEETKSKIFDPFFSTKGMERGTGLGLASAYGIIKNHGGFIDVQSVIEEGSTFNIFLPASKKHPLMEKKLPKGVSKGVETLLLVDDEDMIIDVNQQLLTELGYRVFIAKSGKEAIKLYKEYKNNIDMVILDMVMPDMDGSESYTNLKKINPDIKALLSSGYSIEGHASDILEQGCDGFIQKPFNMRELSRKIRGILDKT